MLTLASKLLYRLEPERILTRIGMDPDDWQADLLRSQSKRILMNCSRQSGKSSTAAALAMWGALYEPGLYLVVSPGLRQSRELFRKVQECYWKLDKPMPSRVQNKTELELVNGSRIIALPGSEATNRGYSGARLVIFEEASRIVDGMWAAMRPSLAVSGGRIVLLSTPFGARGFFYSEWKDREHYDYYEVPATSCRRIPASFLEEEKRKIGSWFYDQEYNCQFMDAQTAAFRHVDVERAFSQEIEQWNLTAA